MTVEIVTVLMSCCDVSLPLCQHLLLEEHENPAQEMPPEAPLFLLLFLSLFCRLPEPVVVVVVVAAVLIGIPVSEDCC